MSEPLRLFKITAAQRQASRMDWTSSQLPGTPPFHRLQGQDNRRVKLHVGPWYPTRSRHPPRKAHCQKPFHPPARMPSHERSKQPLLPQNLPRLPRWLRPQRQRSGTGLQRTLLNPFPHRRARPHPRRSQPFVKPVLRSKGSKAARIPRMSSPRIKVPEGRRLTNLITPMTHLRSRER